MDQVIEPANVEPARRTPRSLWIVGALSLLWNAMGAIDYTMSQTRNPTYMAIATPAQRAYLDSISPVWVALWALGVWGAVAGSVLLLARSRHAVTAFAVSLVGLAATTLYQWVIAPPAGTRSLGEISFTVALWAVAIALLVFARAMRAKGALR